MKKILKLLSLLTVGLFFVACNDGASEGFTKSGKAGNLSVTYYVVWHLKNCPIYSWSLTSITLLNSRKGTSSSLLVSGDSCQRFWTPKLKYSSFLAQQDQVKHTCPCMDV